MKKPKKPVIVRAKNAGSCYRCGAPIYYGDNIRIVVDNTYTPSITKACHSDCY